MLSRNKKNIWQSRRERGVEGKVRVRVLHTTVVAPLTTRPWKDGGGGEIFISRRGGGGVLTREAQTERTRQGLASLLEYDQNFSSRGHGIGLLAKLLFTCNIRATFSAPFCSQRYKSNLQLGEPDHLGG